MQQGRSDKATQLTRTAHAKGPAGVANASEDVPPSIFFDADQQRAADIGQQFKRLRDYLLQEYRQQLFDQKLLERLYCRWAQTAARKVARARLAHHSRLPAKAGATGGPCSVVDALAVRLRLDPTDKQHRQCLQDFVDLHKNILNNSTAQRSVFLLEGSWYTLRPFVPRSVEISTHAVLPYSSELSWLRPRHNNDLVILCSAERRFVDDCGAFCYFFFDGKDGRTVCIQVFCAHPHTAVNFPNMPDAREIFASTDFARALRKIGLESSTADFLRALLWCATALPLVLEDAQHVHRLFFDLDDPAEITPEPYAVNITALPENVVITNMWLSLLVYRYFNAPYPHWEARRCEFFSSRPVCSGLSSKRRRHRRKANPDNPVDARWFRYFYGEQTAAGDDPYHYPYYQKTLAKSMADLSECLELIDNNKDNTKEQLDFLDYVYKSSQKLFYRIGGRLLRQQMPRIIREHSIEAAKFIADQLRAGSLWVMIRNNKNDIYLMELFSRTNVLGSAITQHLKDIGGYLPLSCKITKFFEQFKNDHLQLVQWQAQGPINKGAALVNRGSGFRSKPLGDHSQMPGKKVVVPAIKRLSTTPRY